MALKDLALKDLALKDLALWLVAIALILHTIAEAWLPDYEQRKPDWQAVVFNRTLFLDNVPIFVFAIVLAAIGWHLPIVSGILPAVGVTHPARLSPTAWGLGRVLDQRGQKVYP